MYVQNLSSAWVRRKMKWMESSAVYRLNRSDLKIPSVLRVISKAQCLKVFVMGLDSDCKIAEDLGK